MPLWDDLGRELATELQDYPYVGALDAISAFAHEYGRPKLVERVAELLLTKEASPGDAHRAFCSIPFDIVCTTNIDFLLERQYQATFRYCRPVIDEDHLTVNDQSSATMLLKFHGDLHHPNRLVLTEEDYDSFLDKFPLIATYLANLLITRTPVLIGYSLDDPDFRQIWQVVSNRLGKVRRFAYAILIDPKYTDIARFARRGVKIIGLPGSQSNYSHILAATFDELREYMNTNLINASHISEEESLSEFSLPQEAITRLCFFSIPLTLQSQYRDLVFPLAERAGLVPISAADVLTPGDNYHAKIDAIIGRSIAAVVDVSTQHTLVELGIILGIRDPSRILVISEDNSNLLSDAAYRYVVQRSNEPFVEQPAFLNGIEDWFRELSAKIRPALEDEPRRLFNAGEYRASVISAIIHLEQSLRMVLERQELLLGRAYSLAQLSELAIKRELLEPDDHRLIRDWMRIRNAVVHKGENVTRTVAKGIVEGVLTIVERLRPNVV